MMLTMMRKEGEKGRDSNVDEVERENGGRGGENYKATR